MLSPAVTPQRMDPKIPDRITVRRLVVAAVREEETRRRARLDRVRRKIERLCPRERMARCRRRWVRVLDEGPRLRVLGEYESKRVWFVPAPLRREHQACHPLRLSQFGVEQVVTNLAGRPLTFVKQEVCAAVLAQFIAEAPTR